MSLSAETRPLKLLACAVTISFLVGCVGPREESRRDSAEPTAATPAPNTPVQIEAASRPSHPSKYDFGAGDGSFTAYLAGELWTGVEAARTRSGSVTYDWYIGPRETARPRTFTVDQTAVSRLALVDPSAVDLALRISELMRQEAGGDDHLYDRSDFERAMQAATSDADAGGEKSFGLVLVQQPSKQAYGTQYLGYGRFEDEFSVTLELFCPVCTADRAGDAWGHVMEMVTMNALGLLQTQTPYLIGPDTAMRKQINELGLLFIPLVPRETVRYEG